MNQRPVYHRNPEGNGKVLGCLTGTIFGGFFLLWPLFLKPASTAWTVEGIWAAVLTVFFLLARGYNTTGQGWCPEHAMHREFCPCSRLDQVDD